MHLKTEESITLARRNGAPTGIAEDLAIADAVNRLADAAEDLAKIVQRIETVAEIAGRLLTEPLAIVTMVRQIERIGKNLEKADEQHRERAAKDEFARALNMTDAELAS